jgi:hypothetical protein
MQRSLTARGYGNLRIFNFGINGATAQLVNYLIREILPPEHLPPMILWADGVRAFNSGRFDRTFAAVLASAGHQRIGSGIRPQLAQAQPYPTTCHEFPALCVARGSKFNFYQAKPDITLDPIMGDSSADWELTDLVYRSGQQPVNLTPISLDNIDAQGFLPLSDRYNPNTYYQRRPYVSGRYDGDYQSFNLEGVQARAFDSVVAFTRGRNISLVLVNLPLTQGYLDSVRWSAERQFRDRMIYLSRQQGFLFVDLSQRALTQYDYFVDPSHLNRYGARAVSQKLVAEPSIPWPRRRN